MRGHCWPGREVVSSSQTQPTTTVGWGWLRETSREVCLTVCLQQGLHIVNLLKN